MGLIDDLRVKAPVALDTCIFIYFIEENHLYLPLIKEVFRAISSRHLIAITSALTVMELTVLPYRLKNIALAQKYESLITNSRGIKCQEISLTICKAAAQLRAAYNIKTADALQIATAIMTACPIFVTNDRDLPKIAEIEIVQIKDYLK